MIVAPEYRIRSGESETAYMIRICSLVPLVIETWEEAGSILNDQLGHDYTSDAYRKPVQNFLKISNALAQDKAVEQEYISELEKARIELQKEKFKLNDLNSRYKMYLRESSRFELAVEQIVEEVRKDKKLSDPIKPLLKVDSKKRAAIAYIADCHDGAEFEITGLFGETLNKYSPEIFEERMWKAAEEILAVANKEKIYKWYIFDLGDSIEGILRLSSLHYVRWGVSESAIHYAKFVAKWLKYLSNYIYVDFRQIAGNHDDLRLLTGKKGDFPDEKATSFINVIIGAYLEDNPNVVLTPTHENKHIFLNLFDEFNILATHGEEKDQAKAISDYETLYGVNIHYLIGAHKHFNYMQEVGFDKMVFRVRSIMGINDFSVSILKSANPGMNIHIYEGDGKGLRNQYNITLGDRQ